MAALNPHHSVLDAIMTPHLVADADDSTRTQLLLSACAEIEELLETFYTLYRNPATHWNLRAAFGVFLAALLRGSEQQVCEVVIDNFQNVCNDIFEMGTEHMEARVEFCELQKKRVTIRIMELKDVDEKERKERIQEVCAGVVKLWKGARERLEKLKVDALQLSALGEELGLVM